MQDAVLPPVKPSYTPYFYAAESNCNVGGQWPYVLIQIIYCNYVVTLQQTYDLTGNTEKKLNSTQFGEKTTEKCFT